LVCHWPSGSREGQWFAFGGVDPCEVHAQRGWAAQCLIHGAVALGGGYEGIKVFGRGIALAVEAKPDRRKPAKAALSMLYNAAEVEISLGARLKQHVARACKASISSTGGVQARPG
jgi:hypothetical protein